MSIFDKNGMLSRQEQMEIKSQEQKILASNATDNHKANQIDLLYTQRGLEPGSFYRADFDGEHHPIHAFEYDDGEEVTLGLGGWKIWKWIIATIIVMVIFHKINPVGFEVFWHGSMVFIQSVGETVLWLIAKLWNSI